MKRGPSIAFRLTVYPLVLILFVLISGLMVFFAAGYNLKYENGRFFTQKTGIIIVSTRPGDSTVVLDGDVQRQKTPSFSLFTMKIKRVSTGSHRLVVSHDGYETWEGDVMVKPGLVSWRDYLILVPLERKADAFNIAGTIESTVTSRDQKSMVIYAADHVQNIYSFWQLNTENKETTKVAEGRLTSGDTLELLDISSDYSKYLYRKTDASKKVTHIVAENKEDGLSYDLGSLFSNQAERYNFSPYNTNELYFTQTGNLFKINLENKTESAVLAKNVIGVHSAQNGLLISRLVEENYGLWTINDNGDLKNVIKSLPAATSYEVSYLESKKSYLVRNQADGDLLLYANEIKNPTLETVGRATKLYSSSPDGEKIAIYAEDSLRVYDISEQKYYDIAQANSIAAIDWMIGGDNLVYRTDTEVRLVNYNGDYNKALFTAVGSGLLISPDTNHNIFFVNALDADKDLYSFSL